MSFVQIIEYETDRADELQDMMDQFRAELGEPPFDRMLVTQDRDNPRRYLTIVEFPSYEEAMANSERPETSKMAAQFASMCTSGPTYHNLDTLATAP